MLKSVKVYLIIATLVSLYKSTEATTIVPVNLVQLAESSDLAFTGTVSNVQTIKTPNGYGQQVTVQISDKVFGISETSSTITWVQAKTSKNVVFPGMPQYRLGSKYLVYLTGKAPGSSFQAPQALGYGAFQLIRNSDTNQVFARNSYMNSSLLKNTDVTKLAVETVRKQSNGRKLNPLEAKDKALKLQGTLSSQFSGGTDLNSLIDVSKSVHKMKQDGINASIEFQLKKNE